MREEEYREGGSILKVVIVTRIGQLLANLLPVACHRQTHRQVRTKISAFHYPLGCLCLFGHIQLKEVPLLRAHLNELIGETSSSQSWSVINLAFPQQNAGLLDGWLRANQACGIA